MRYVLDACIPIASMRPSEPLYVVSLGRIQRLQSGADTIVVPSLFQVEVTAGLTRGGLPPAVVEAFVDELLAHAEVVTVGPIRARQIAGVAMRARLRAGDAAYVWLAAREAVPLVTDDQEIISRAGTVCTVQAP